MSNDPGAQLLDSHPHADQAVSLSPGLRSCRLRIAAGRTILPLSPKTTVSVMICHHRQIMP
jgi:hypothetical protein